ncbi:MAG: DNA repair protein RecN [Abditibacteriota bacterium]|nr:DNA repair protein RecN [Abditibacteriota bacterium]
MLKYIKLENFAIIDNLNLQFNNGFNTITGETGAGKSIIIDAISIACGERCGVGVIGQFGDKSKIEICFDISNYDNIKKDIGKDSIVFVREIYKSGRNVFKINGNTENAQTVKKISENLMDVYGQHEHQRLFLPSYHLELIDNLSPNIISLRDEYFNLYTEYKELEKNLEYLKAHQYEIKRNVDLYTYEANEIDTAELKVGEEEELEAENDKLNNIENINTLLSEAYGLITGDYGVENTLSNISKNIEQAYSYDSKLDSQYNTISEIITDLNELSSSLDSYLEKLREGDFDFTTVANRLDLIKTLKKKYSMTVEEILAYREKIGKDLSLYTSDDFNVESMEEDLKKKFDVLYLKAQELSDIRKDMAKGFSLQVEKNLVDLGMPNCKFEVDFSECAPSPKGIDDIEFLISPNPGMPVMSLRKIASGGELSRVFLAIIINRLKDAPPLVIFDEIDAGIGGVTGEKIGNKLKEISKISQVICITHLPQIAAKSEKQFNVTKTGLLNETIVNVNDLSFEERIKVIANMFGDGESQTSLKHAKELLMQNAE